MLRRGVRVLRGGSMKAVNRCMKCVVYFMSCHALDVPSSYFYALLCHSSPSMFLYAFLSLSLFFEACFSLSLSAKNIKRNKNFFPPARLFADILNDVAMFVEILAPNFPACFTLIVCTAGIFKVHNAPH